MRHGRLVFALGDVHGYFGQLNSFINKRIRESRQLRRKALEWADAGDDFGIVILQCGDFAWLWPGEDNAGAIRNAVDWLPGGHVPIRWCGGNHEDWDALDALGTEAAEIDRGIFFQPFGSVLDIGPDTRVLFAGGAESGDREWRLKEMEKGGPRTWWPQEGISDADMDRLPERADWVISHTCPPAFEMEGRDIFGQWHPAHPSQIMLGEVLDRIRPRRWSFGHFHRHRQGIAGKCRWECLADLASFQRSWSSSWIEWDD